MFWLILVFKRNGLTPSRDTPLGVLESWCIWAVWSHVACKAPGDSAGIIHSVCEAHQLLPLCTMHPCTNLHDQQRERNLEERNLKQRERRDILWILQSSWFPCSCLTASKFIEHASIVAWIAPFGQEVENQVLQTVHLRSNWKEKASIHQCPVCQSWDQSLVLRQNIQGSPTQTCN